MRVTVLVGEQHSSGKRFIDAINSYSDDNFTIRQYHSVAVVIKDGAVSAFYLDDAVDVADTDLVYLRGITDEALRHTLAAYLKSRGVPVVNTESHCYQTMTKLEQNVVLALAGVSVPDGIFMTDAAQYGRVSELMGWDYPFIVKSIGGKNGLDNFLLKNERELQLQAAGIAEPIFQSFIPNDFDYRVIVAGDEVMLAYKRIRGSSGHKNNISQGGEREVVELPTELQHMAVKAARALGREFTGVDIISDTETGRSYVLEANFNFGTPVFDDAALERAYYRRLSAYFRNLTGLS